jgi:hypothetical protein
VKVLGKTFCQPRGNLLGDRVLNQTTMGDDGGGRAVRSDELELQARILRIWERKLVVLTEGVLQFFRPANPTTREQPKLLFELPCDKILVRYPVLRPAHSLPQTHTPSQSSTHIHSHPDAACLLQIFSCFCIGLALCRCTQNNTLTLSLCQPCTCTPSHDAPCRRVDAIETQAVTGPTTDKHVLYLQTGTSMIPVLTCAAQRPMRSRRREMSEMSETDPSL